MGKILDFCRVPTRALMRGIKRWTSVDIIPINGLIMNTVYVEKPDGLRDAAAVLRVPTINYSLRDPAQQDQVDDAYRQFLNALPWPIMWRFSVRQVDPRKLTGAVAERLKATRDQKVRHWLQDQQQHLTNLVQTNDIPDAALHLVVTSPADMRKEPRDRHVLTEKELQARCTHLINTLRPCGMEPRRLEPMELMHLLWADFNPDLAMTHRTPSPQSLMTHGLGNVPAGIFQALPSDGSAQQDLVGAGAQATIVDTVFPKDLEFQKWYMEINREYRCVLKVGGWPTYLQPNALRGLLNSNLNLDVSLHIVPFETADVLRFLSDRINKLTYSLEKDRVEGYLPDQYARRYRDQAEFCREELETGRQRWFYTSLYVAVTAPSLERLKEDVQMVETLLARVSMKAWPAFRQQPEGLFSTLPIGLDALGDQRNMLTSGVVNLNPFDCQVFHQEEGFYAGINRVNNSLISLNVWNLDNYNMFIGGLPGKGKTMLERHKITCHHCLSDDHQIIGDPDGEMDAMVEELGGSVIRLGPSSPHRINIMDLALDFDADSRDHRRGKPLDKQVQYLSSWLEQQIGAEGPSGRRSFSPSEKAQVMHAIVQTYGGCGITMENQGDILRGDRLVDMPTLDDLQAQMERITPHLVPAMDIFRYGTMRIFNERTNVDIDNRLVSLNLKGLDPATRRLASPWILNWMWGRVGLNRARKRRTHLYFEEVLWFLEDPLAAEYISMIWTRGRKWGCSPCAVSQLIFRLLNTTTGATIVKSSDLKVLFDQGDALDDVVAACKLSGVEASYIKGSAPGDGLYVVGPWRVPFRLALSQYQYEYYSTRPGELKE